MSEYTIGQARAIGEKFFYNEHLNAKILHAAESRGIFKRNLDLTLHLNQIQAAKALFDHLLATSGYTVDELSSLPVANAIRLLRKPLEDSLTQAEAEIITAMRNLEAFSLSTAESKEEIARAAKGPRATADGSKRAFSKLRDKGITESKDGAGTWLTPDWHTA